MSIYEPILILNYSIDLSTWFIYYYISFEIYSNVYIFLYTRLIKSHPIYTQADTACVFFIFSGYD